MLQTETDPLLKFCPGACEHFINIRVIGKAIPIQTWVGAEGPRSLRFQDYQTVGT